MTTIAEHEHCGCCDHWDCETVPIRRASGAA